VLDFAANIAGATVPSGGALGAGPVDAQVTASLRGLSDLAPKPLPIRLREWQAAGGRLEITSARVTQGEAVAIAKGDVGLSVRGRLDGGLAITLAGFEHVVQMVVGGQGKNTGLLAAAGLSFLGKPAELDGKRAVAVPLRFNDGRIYLGPVPLGQTAPLY
jgi:hypothetical protein